jgi:predicted TIM-barrel fold metal-dependent hydrolase
MIVDAHAHAFPYLGDASGFPTAEEHVRFLQRHFTTHPQGGRRVSDNQIVSEPTLWDGVTPGFEGLLEVEFRVGRFGRFEWTKDGVDYYIQWLPPHLEGNEATPERMLAQMQYLGVEKALLQRSRLYGIIDDYIGEIVKRWPHRFRGCIQVDEAAMDQQSEIDYLRRGVHELGLTALYIDNERFWLGAQGADFGARQFIPFWEEIQALAIPVLWDIRFIQRKSHADYMGEVARLHRLAVQFPSVRHTLTHSIPSHAVVDGRLPDELLALAKLDNVYVELLFPILYGASWDYPYAESRPLIRQLYDRVGGSKLLWGSDMPNVERSCTYQQSLSYLTRYCDFISASAMDRIAGLNADELYFG